LPAYTNTALPMKNKWTPFEKANIDRFAYTHSLQQK